jgi:hypothetical protein
MIDPKFARNLKIALIYIITANMIGAVLFLIAFILSGIFWFLIAIILMFIACLIAIYFINVFKRKYGR